MTANDANDTPELLEDLGDELMPEELGVPSAAPGAAVATVASPAHKQLYQFLWAGIAIFFGCCLPFHNRAMGWDEALFQPELRGPIGLMTLGGSVVAFAALLCIGAQLYCIKYSKVMLGPMALFVLIAFWSWMRVAQGFGGEGIGGEDGAWFKILYDAQYNSDFWSHIGPGYLFTALGSTYAILVLAKAVLGGGKKDKSGAASPSGSRRGGRRR